MILSSSEHLRIMITIIAEDLQFDAHINVSKKVKTDIVNASIIESKIQRH